MMHFEELDDLRNLQLHVDGLDPPRRYALQDLSATEMMRGPPSVSNLVLVPSDSFLPVSPEEEAVTQRSKRLLTPCRPPALFGDRTPSNTDPSLLKMARKRLMMSPSKSPDSKRPCLSVPLRTELGGYSQQQLVNVIDKLIVRHPCLEEEVRAEMKTPDLKPMEQKLSKLRKAIYRSFPQTRWSSSRDIHSYRHVKTHLVAFKKTCLEQVRCLVTAQCYEAAIHYIIIAWKYTSKLPDWDDPAHNSIKSQCFSVLASHCMNSLKNGQLSGDFIAKLLPELKLLSCTKDLKLCIDYVGSMIQQ